MPVKQEDFDYLKEVVDRAEYLVRLETPDFISGFHTISMHAQRVERTIYRLSGIKDNLKEAEQILLKNIAALRKANPYQKPKGTAYARRRLRSKPLWQKVVSAHALIKDADDESDTEEDSAVIQALMKMRPLTQALMKLSPDDAKIEYERHDQNLRYKLQGISKLTNLVSHYTSMIKPRLARLVYLEGVGKKWIRRVFELYDIEKVAKAQKVVVDSHAEIKMINGVLDIFPEDFTKFCELENFGHGLKRKADITAGVETPETMNSKRSRTNGISKDIKGYEERYEVVSEGTQGYNEGYEGIEGYNERNEGINKGIQGHNERCEGIGEGIIEHINEGIYEDLPGNDNRYEGIGEGFKGYNQKYEGFSGGINACINEGIYEGIQGNDMRYTL